MPRGDNRELALKLVEDGRMSRELFNDVYGDSRQKYGAIATEVDGYTFDSIHEASVFRDLKIRQRAGEISKLEHDKRELHYDLIVNGLKVSRYTADFRYYDPSKEATVVVDAKVDVTKTEAYTIRRKLMHALFGIELLEL